MIHIAQRSTGSAGGDRVLFLCSKDFGLCPGGSAVDKPKGNFLIYRKYGGRFFLWRMISFENFNDLLEAVKSIAVQDFNQLIHVFAELHSFHFGYHRHDLHKK